MTLFPYTTLFRSTNSLSNHVSKETIIRGTDGLIKWAPKDGSKTEYDKGIRIVPFAKGKEEIKIPWAGSDTEKLWTNLLECVKTRQETRSPISQAVRVQAPLSMGVLSHRENKVAMFDFEKQTIRMN
jgi:hypothetical protein